VRQPFAGVEPSAAGEQDQFATRSGKEGGGEVDQLGGVMASGQVAEEIRQSVAGTH
jgi:hypothetical protein